MAATGLEYIDVLGAAKNATIPKDDQEDVCSALLDVSLTANYTTSVPNMTVVRRHPRIPTRYDCSEEGSSV